MNELAELYALYPEAFASCVILSSFGFNWCNDIIKGKPKNKKQFWFWFIADMSLLVVCFISFKVIGLTMFLMGAFICMLLFLCFKLTDFLLLIKPIGNAFKRFASWLRD